MHFACTSGARPMMLNEELVRQGYAMVLTIPPNVWYADRFLQAQEEARTAGRGLWAPWPRCVDA